MTAAFIELDEPPRYAGIAIAVFADCVLTGMVHADHLCLRPQIWWASATARRGGGCLAEPADSVAGAGCYESHRGNTEERTAKRDDLERHGYPPSQSNLCGRAERPAEPRYLLTRLANPRATFYTELKNAL